MSLFTVLDEINAAWEEDKAAAYPDHGYEPSERKFPDVANRCFRVASYNFRNTPEIFEEWARHPDKDGMLGFLRAMVLSDNSRLNVIRDFFGKEDTSMMFADVSFPKDKRYHHIKWGTDSYGNGDVYHVYEYMKKANQILNRNGIPTGEVKNETLDLLAKEWLKDYSVKGKNPELLEMMIRSFYENMSPVAYAVLHQTMMMIYTKFVSSYGPLDEIPSLMREDIAHTFISREFHIGRRHEREKFDREASICAHYAQFGSPGPVWSKSFGDSYLPTSGDFRITNDKMWYVYKGGFYPIVPDYEFMGKETAEIYKKIFYTVFCSIRDAF